MIACVETHAGIPVSKALMGIGDTSPSLWSGLFSSITSGQTAAGQSFFKYAAGSEAASEDTRQKIGVGALVVGGLVVGGLVLYWLVK